ncbi:MAG: glycerol-3-phosphate acyltransferase [Ilumatobacteraceae bacterium]
MTAALALIPVAYLLGTFPSAVIVARAKGVDIHQVGSGNPGASNVGPGAGRQGRRARSSCSTP